MRTLRVIPAFLSIFITAFSAAQSTSNVTQSSAGIQPYQEYNGTRERVNLGNGSLHVELPLISFPQRGGHDPTVGTEYDSQIVNLTSMNMLGGASLRFGCEKSYEDLVRQQQHNFFKYSNALTMCCEICQELFL